MTPLTSIIFFLKRADLNRYNDDKITKRIIRFNLEELINGDSDFDSSLYPADEIKIYSKDMFKTANLISIFGNIREHDDYELKNQI